MRINKMITKRKILAYTTCQIFTNKELTKFQVHLSGILSEKNKKRSLEHAAYDQAQLTCIQGSIHRYESNNFFYTYLVPCETFLVQKYPH